MENPCNYSDLLPGQLYYALFRMILEGELGDFIDVIPVKEPFLLVRKSESENRTVGIANVIYKDKIGYCHFHLCWYPCPQFFEFLVQAGQAEDAL